MGSKKENRSDLTSNLMNGPQKGSKKNTHLFFWHCDCLLEDDPGDALMQRGCGQRPQVGPIVKATG